MHLESSALSHACSSELDHPNELLLWNSVTKVPLIQHLLAQLPMLASWICDTQNAEQNKQRVH